MPERALPRDSGGSCWTPTRPARDLVQLRVRQGQWENCLTTAMSTSGRRSGCPTHSSGAHCCPQLIGQDLQPPRAPPAPYVESDPELHAKPPILQRKAELRPPEAISRLSCHIPSRIKKVVDGARPGRLGKRRRIGYFCTKWVLHRRQNFTLRRQTAFQLHRSSAAL